MHEQTYTKDELVKRLMEMTEGELCDFRNETDTFCRDKRWGSSSTRVLTDYATAIANLLCPPEGESQ